jgi:proline dehydrogenase
VVVLEDSHNGLIQRIVYRFVKRHIAGVTTDSAIRTALQYNGRNTRTTITFLNENGKDQKKARYNINTYLHLIRQISRLRINADISLRPSQIGYPANMQIFEKGISELSSTANSFGVMVWMENERSADMMQFYRHFASYNLKSVGVEMISSMDQNDKTLRALARKHVPIKLDLVAPRRRTSDKLKGYVKGRTGAVREHIDIIRRLYDLNYDLRVVATDERLVPGLIAVDKDYRKNLIFEILLGYGNKKVAELAKTKVNMSVYIPYGKDWIPYAINRFAGGHMRGIATAVLAGQRAEQV